MKKIIYLLFTLSLIFWINNCTNYKPIFNSEKLQYEISDYSITGDKILGNIIYSKLNKLAKSRKNNNARNIDIKINALKDKIATVKNSSGKILQYRISLNTSVEIIDSLSDDMILKHKFNLSTTYKVQDQHFDTVKLENKSIEDLINKMYQDLLINLTQNI